MIPLVVIRPQPGLDRTVAAAGVLGLDTRAWPLFEVRPRSWDPPDPAAIDELLIGSANAVRHAGPAFERFRAKPVRVVGAATADVCREAGLKLAAVGEGHLQPVLDAVAPGSRVLRLAGEERVPLTPPDGVVMTERAVYAVEPLPLPPGLVDTLRGPCAVALHSAAAARHFAAECDRRNLDRGILWLVTIGPRITDAAGMGWAGIATASKPEDEALLACAVQLCQKPGSA
jgi:uroporphyrinogen-III synthase